MLIDNKVDRYGDGLDITIVWDFLNEFSGMKNGQVGNLDIVTGYFTIHTLSKLYEEMPEETHFRVISSEMVMITQILISTIVEIVQNTTRIIAFVCIYIDTQLTVLRQQMSNK